MPRKNRIVASDGLYHVVNRGNYRSFIFETEGAKLSFEKRLVLFCAALVDVSRQTARYEACESFSWRLHAHCLMSNRFHLCIATPAGNLSEGMRWLQATFATRFNRFRKESGHLFQGRFKSLLVEPGSHLVDLVDYVHLNPARSWALAGPSAGRSRSRRS